jgi:hypothetical protein
VGVRSVARLFVLTLLGASGLLAAAPAHAAFVPATCTAADTEAGRVVTVTTNDEAHVQLSVQRDGTFVAWPSSGGNLCAPWWRRRTGIEPA